MSSAKAVQNPQYIQAVPALPVKTSEILAVLKVSRVLNPEILRVLAVYTLGVLPVL